MRNLNERLGNILLELGYITAEDLREAFRYQHTWKCRMGEALVDLGFVKEEVVLDFLSLQLGVEWVRLTGMKIPDYILRRLPEEVAVEVHCVPLGLLRSGMLKVAMRDPQNLFHRELLRQATGFEIDPVLAGDKDIAAAISRHYDSDRPLDSAAGETTPTRNFEETKPSAPTTPLTDPWGALETTVVN